MQRIRTSSGGLGKGFLKDVENPIFKSGSGGLRKGFLKDAENPIFERGISTSLTYFWEKIRSKETKLLQFTCPFPFIFIHVLRKHIIFHYHKEPLSFCCRFIQTFSLVQISHQNLLNSQQCVFSNNKSNSKWDSKSKRLLLYLMILYSFSI